MTDCEVKDVSFDVKDVSLDVRIVSLPKTGSPQQFTCKQRERER